MRRELSQFALVLLTLPMLGPAASSPPVTLLDEAALKTKSLLLSDLLPLDASAELRSASSKVALGSTPAPGSVRRMSREEVEHALLDEPALLAEIAIPKFIDVRRSCRQLTTSEVTAAVSSVLESGTPADLAGSRIELATPVYVTQDDPGLEVSEIEFDALHQVTRFRLSISKEPGHLPFFVTVPGRFNGKLRAGNLGEAKTGRASAKQSSASTFPGSTMKPERDQAAQAPPSRNERAELMVKAGAETRLVIQGADYRLTSTVIPLQSGTLGQQIRVRDPVTRKLLTAQVVGPGLLTGTL